MSCEQAQTAYEYARESKHTDQADTGCGRQCNLCGELEGICAAEEIERIKKECEELDKIYKESEIDKLKKQIESLKCCGNCKHFKEHVDQNRVKTDHCMHPSTPGHVVTGSLICDKWEILL